MNKQLTELIQRLLFGRAQFHAWHLVTRSYARHKAFETIYESLSGHADTIAESVQDDQRLSLNTTFEFDDCEDNAETYLRDLLVTCAGCYAKYEDESEDEESECPAYIQNIIQDLEKDLHKGLYLLSLE